MHLESAKGVAMMRHRLLSLNGVGSSHSTRLLHGLPTPEGTYTKEANYPKIPKAVEGSRRSNHLKLKAYSKSLKTVEEKQFLVQKPKFYGWHAVDMHDDNTPYNTLDFMQFVTLTKLVDGKMPAKVEDVEISQESLKKVGAHLKKVMKDHDQYNYTYLTPDDRVPMINRRPIDPKHHRVNHSIIEAKSDRIHKALFQALNKEMPWLRKSEICYASRNEAFWFRADFHPDARMINKKKKLKERQEDPTRRVHYNERTKMTEEKIHEKHDRAICYRGKSLIQMRGPKMLSPFVDVNDPICHGLDAIPVVDQNPKTYNYDMNSSINAVNTPGYWGASRNKYTSLHWVTDINKFARANNEVSEVNAAYIGREEWLVNKAMKTAFSLLFAQACMTGADPFNNPEIPMCTHNIVSNGRNVKFSAYQLNKTSLFSTEEVEAEDGLTNVMWHLPEMELYSESGEVNEEALKWLVKFYGNEPARAYTPDVDSLHEFGNTYNREVFHDYIRTIYSRKPEHYARQDIELNDKLFFIWTKILFTYGTREMQPWMLGPRHFLGKEHFNPEFKHWDYRHGPFLHRKFRVKRKDGSGKFLKTHYPNWRAKKVFLPLDHNDDPEPPTKQRVDPMSGRYQW